jgi:hypothetical protein
MDMQIQNPDYHQCERCMTRLEADANTTLAEKADAHHQSHTDADATLAASRRR